MGFHIVLLARRDYLTRNHHTPTTVEAMRRAVAVLAAAAAVAAALLIPAGDSEACVKTVAVATNDWIAVNCVEGEPGCHCQ